GQVPDPPPYGICPTVLVTSCVPELTRVLAKPITAAGWTRIHIPNAVAATIHTDDSMVSVIRFRMSPYHPNHTAPRMTTVGMSGCQIPSRRTTTTLSTMSLKLDRSPSEVAA